MDLKSLSKEQKQAIILILMLSIGGIYALIRFGLKPSLETFREASEELDVYRSRMTQAERLVAQEDDIRSQLDDSMKTLVEYDANYLPPSVNALSWATETIYRNARNVDVEVESVAQVRGTMVPWEKSKKIERVFIPFTVRITTRGTYFQLIQFIEEIQNSNPYVAIVDIQVSSSSQSPDQHRILIEAEWPSWKNKTAKDWIKGIPQEPAAVVRGQ